MKSSAKTKSKRKTARKPRAAARPKACDHCFHLMDGYLHGRDVPAGHVKEECCHCHDTRVIPREQCAEIMRRERSHRDEFTTKMWVLTKPCERTRVTFDAGQRRAVA